MFPLNQFVEEGDTLTFECDSQTPVQWSKQGSSETYRGRRNKLVLEKVAMTDSGRYTCHGTIYSGGQLTDFQSTVDAYVGSKQFLLQ